MIFAASGIVALGAVIGIFALMGGGGGSVSAGDVPQIMRQAGFTYKTAPDKGRQHVTSVDAKIKYNTVPPSSGNHYYQPAAWGFYTTPANPIQVVHNQEHGGVILWWGDKVPQSTIDQLRKFYDESPNAMLGTPYAPLGNKIAITAWTAPAGGLGEGHVATGTKFDEKAFKAFRDAFRGKGPERFPVDILTPGT